MFVVVNVLFCLVFVFCFCFCFCFFSVALFFFQEGKDKRFLMERLNHANEELTQTKAKLVEANELLAKSKSAVGKNAIMKTTSADDTPM